MPTSPEARSAISDLFDSNAPVLIEVYFPGCATSPDWYLCKEEEEFDAILTRLGAGAELHLVSVWKLPEGAPSIIVRK